MVKVSKLEKTDVDIVDSKHIDINIVGDECIDVNIRECKSVTVSIDDNLSNFAIHLNGVVYELSDDGKSLVAI